jgi:hypothetical protein
MSSKSSVRDWDKEVKYESLNKKIIWKARNEWLIWMLIHEIFSKAIKMVHIFNSCSPIVEKLIKIRQSVMAKVIREFFLD